MKRNSKLSIMLLMVMVLQVIAPIMDIRAEEVSGIIDNISLNKSYLATGSEPFDVSVTWSLKNRDIKTGDVFTFTIPEELKAFNHNIELRDSEGNIYATGVPGGRNIVFTFTDMVEKRTDVSGSFTIGKASLTSRVTDDNRGKGQQNLELEFKENGVRKPSNITVDFGVIEENPDVPTGPIDRDLFKTGKLNDDDTDIIDWNVYINESKSKYGDTFIKDTVDGNQEIIEDSVSLTNWSGVTLIQDGKKIDTTSSIRSIDVNKKSININLDLKQDIYLLSYKTKIKSGVADKKVSNTVEIDFNGVNKKISESESVEIMEYSGNAIGKLPKKGEVKIVKLDREDENKNLEDVSGLDGVEFKLVDSKGKETAQTTDENGIALFTDINVGKYKLLEVKTKKGYEKDLYVKDGEDYKLFKDGYDLEVKDNGEGIYILASNKKAISKKSISLEKEWIGGKVRPEIEVELLGKVGDKEVSKEVIKLNKENNFKLAKEVPSETEAGEEITYSVKELTEIKDFTSKVEEKDGNFKIINKYNPGKKSISLEKEWIGGKVRPEIEVELLGKVEDKEVSKEVIKLNKENNFKLAKEVPSETEAGEEINYSVKELTEVKGYTPIIESNKDGFTIKNVYRVEKAKLDIKKTWIGGKARPEIEVEIKGMASGTEVYSELVKLNKENNFKLSLYVDKETKDGDLIEYTVVELTRFKDYLVEVKGNMEDGFEIVNSFIEENEEGKKDENPKEDHDVKGEGKDDEKDKPSDSPKTDLKENESNKFTKLPKTGEKNQFILVLFGLVALFVGIRLNKKERV